ncbi:MULTISPECIES: hypothetical protein [Candidatus Ichthyocystis]|uniref:hypothetical protein n=1 Tax=Candidatus Ichthyocystis TaxID=2929841 RepID=UPI001146FC8F|nr:MULTISPECIES: hypothetical protein [Ichthyocystis]
MNKPRADNLIGTDPCEKFEDRWRALVIYRKNNIAPMITSPRKSLACLNGTLSRESVGRYSQ